MRSSEGLGSHQVPKGTTPFASEHARWVRFEAPAPDRRLPRATPLPLALRPISYSRAGCSRWSWSAASPASPSMARARCSPSPTRPEQRARGAAPTATKGSRKRTTRTSRPPRAGRTRKRQPSLDASQDGAGRLLPAGAVPLWGSHGAATGAALARPRPSVQLSARNSSRPAPGDAFHPGVYDASKRLGGAACA